MKTGAGLLREEQAQGAAHLGRRERLQRHASGVHKGGFSNLCDIMFVLLNPPLLNPPFVNSRTPSISLSPPAAAVMPTSATGPNCTLTALSFLGSSQRGFSEGGSSN